MGFNLKKFSYDGTGELEYIFFTYQQFVIDCFNDDFLGGVLADVESQF